MSQNLSSLLFALIVLFAVLIGGISKEAPQEAALEHKSEITSLLASVKTIAPIILPSGVSAAAVLVRDLFAAEPMLAINTFQQWPMASLTKLMTAVVALENVAKDAQIKMSEKAIATESAAGNFAIGGVYSLDDLVRALLRISSNDAAAALAEHLGESRFLQLMHQKALELNPGFVKELEAFLNSLPR